MVGLLAFALGCHPAGLEAELGPTLRERFGDHAFLTPRDTPPTVALVAGGTVDTRAATCAGCHGDHAHEWGQTTHAAAMRDPQLFAELAKPDQPVWLCLNCHAPTAPQRAEAITLDTRLASPDSVARLVPAPNPDFDATRVAEGVTCAACHVRRDADGQGVVLGPRGSGRAPHRVREDRAALDGVCVSCHSPGAISISATFPCWFQTAEELAAGPAAGTPCVDCHMPTTERPAAAGGPAVELRRHVWAGGGVPKTVEGYGTLAERGWRSGLAVRVAATASGAAPLTVDLTNAGAGHDLPTGDPERFLRVEARLEGDGATARDVLRLGQTWDWGDEAAGRPAHRLDDSRLRPGATRHWTPSLPARRAERLVVEVASVRFTAENAARAAKTRLPPALLTLWPEAQSAVDTITATYPLATFVWRGTLALPGGAWPLAAGSVVAAGGDGASPGDGAPTVDVTAPVDVAALAGAGAPAWVVAAPGALLADSAAFAALPLDTRAARLAVP